MCDLLIKQLNDWETDHLQMMEMERLQEYKKSSKYKNELRFKKLTNILNEN